jgi:transcriptional regulator with XRE-family HTH domain
VAKGPGDTHLARALREWRAAEHLSQEQAAELLSVSKRSVQDYERGRTERPHPATLYRIADVIGKEPEELLAGPNEERAERSIRETLEALRRDIDRLREELDDRRPRE